MKVRKGRAGSSEIDLEKWCKRRVEVEREVKEEGVDGAKKVGTPKQGENEAKQKEEGMAGVAEIKKMIQEMGLQQQEMMKGLRDIGKKIGAKMRNLKNEIKEEMRRADGGRKKKNSRKNE
ncbi:hypothetical protein K0M31_008917 [Melipona bicolor]|uniref:Uncharacterized protein n=1 Tax=Melipona bicolor TaxID=60889 RepID=A0AA40FQ39_9HYME|nr:hypothetical protein K0M31_008917 [Melipona bicolor]